MTVVVRPAANAEPMEALGWLVRRGRVTGVNRLWNLYEDGLERIEAAPRSHPPDDDAPPGFEVRYHLLPSFNYRIIYQVRSAEVVVVSLARVGRRPGHYHPRLTP